MIHYTDQITLLMQDIVARVPSLSFIDMREVLVFARFGRAGAEGAFATCHSLNLPTSEPGYYYWRDRRSGRVTRRSEWFVTKSPDVVLGSTRIRYLISFVLPRFCNQSLERSRKGVYYPDCEPWVAKLDTLVHELYHIDPDEPGLRRFLRSDGGRSSRSHGPEFYETVAGMVRTYLASGPDAATYDFLRYDFPALESRFGGVCGTTFRNFPSFPQRYREILPAQPPSPRVKVEPLKGPAQPVFYGENDLGVRQFLALSTRRVAGDRTRRPGWRAYAAAQRAFA